MSTDWLTIVAGDHEKSLVARCQASVERIDCDLEMHVEMHTPDLTVLRWARPGTSMCSFTTTITADRLIIDGDQSPFVFARRGTDWAGFFGDSAGVNLSYWGEKVAASREPITRYSTAAAREALADLVREAVEQVADECDFGLVEIVDPIWVPVRRDPDEGEDADDVNAEHEDALDALARARDDVAAIYEQADEVWSHVYDDHTAAQALEAISDLRVVTPNSDVSISFEDAYDYEADAVESYTIDFVQTCVRLRRAMGQWSQVRETTPFTHVPGEA